MPPGPAPILQVCSAVSTPLQSRCLGPSAVVYAIQELTSHHQAKRAALTAQMGLYVHVGPHPHLVRRHSLEP